MQKQFWVIGAEYTDIDFSRPIEGTARIHGPFANWLEAKHEWHERANSSRHEALTRYMIVAEAGRQNATQS